MAKPDSAGEGQDKLKKPSDSKHGSTPFSGGKHPLADKDAQKILQKHDSGADKNSTANPIEQFFQTVQKVTKAAQDAVGVAVDTSKQVAHDVSETIRTGQDVGKQLEKSSDTIVAKTLSETSKIEKALGKSADEIKNERKVAASVYELKKHDAQEAAKAISAFVDGSDKSQKQVVEAATHSGDVAKAIESHGNQIVDGLLHAKVKVDILLGRDIDQSQKENFAISAGYGFDKSLVKGVTGIVSMLDRPQDKDVQFLNRIAPVSGATLALTRNLADATGHIWNAGGKYIDHVNKVGIQAAGDETWKSTQNWMMHAKPYDWSEKVTDVGMLVTGGIGLAKTGISLVGKISMAQKAVAATEALGTGATAATTTEAIVETANVVKMETAAASKESAVVSAQEAEKAATALKQESKPLSTAEHAKLDALAQDATTQLVDKVSQTADELHSTLKSILKNGDEAIQQTLKELNPENIDPKKLPGPQQKSFNSLTNEWKKLKGILGKLDNESGITNEQLFKLTKDASQEANKLKPVNKILEGSGKSPIDTDKLVSLEKTADRIKQLHKSIDPKNKILQVYEQAARASETGGSVSEVRAALAVELQTQNKGSSELVNLKKLCQELNPKHAQKIEQAINQELQLRQMDWPDATRIRTGEQIGTQLGSEDFLAAVRQDSTFQSMPADSKKLAEKFIEQNLTDRSYAYKLEKLPGDDHFMATVVDVSDHVGGVKLYQQEIKAGQNIFGVRHVLARQNLGLASEAPYFKITNLKIEGKQGIVGSHEGTPVEPWEIDKNKYQIYDHEGKVKGEVVPDVNFTFDSHIGGFIRDTQHYIDYLTKMLKDARLPNR